MYSVTFLVCALHGLQCCVRLWLLLLYNDVMLVMAATFGDEVGDSDSDGRRRLCFFLGLPDARAVSASLCSSHARAVSAT